MADNKITLVKHLQLLAMRCSAMVTSKVAELATTTSEALEEMDEVKQNKITGTAGHLVVIDSSGVVTTKKPDYVKYSEVTAVTGDMVTARLAE